MMLKTKNLTKKYSKILAVNKLSLHIKEGSIYGLLGPNGAGKTTTLCMLSTLIKPSSGSIYINGISITDHPNKVRELIGILPQNATFYPHRTVLDHMLFYSKLKELNNNKENSIQLLKSVGLGKRINTKVKELSHGMSKMLAIAQAFIGSPKIVFLDEPIAGLDPKITHTIRNFIREQSKSTTILLSSHNLEEVEKLCTHVGIIHQGTLKKEDKISKLENKAEEVIIGFKELDKKTLDLFKSFNYKKEGSTLKIKARTPSNTILKIITKHNIDINSFRKGKSLEDVFLESYKT